MNLISAAFLGAVRSWIRLFIPFEDHFVATKLQMGLAVFTR